MNNYPWMCLSCDGTFPHEEKEVFEAHLKDLGHVTEEHITTIDGAGAPPPKQ